jgi:hypothetical protein
MLSQERIPIGKLKQAYGLTEQEADVFITAIARQNCIDLYENWREAEYFFFAKKNSENETDGEAVKPYFPETFDLKKDLLEERIATKRMLRHFLRHAKNATPREYLHKIFDRILQFTYDEADKSHFDLVEKILDLIYEQRHFELRRRGWVDLLGGAYVSPELFTKFCSFFDDAITVDKVAAIRYLFESGYPLKREVKGISKDIVKRLTVALDSPPEETPAVPPTSSVPEEVPATPLVAPLEGLPVAPSAPSSPEEVPIAPPPTPSKPEIVVRRNLWEGKRPTTICEAMRAAGLDDFVIAYVLYNSCGQKKKHIGRLLGDDQNQEDSTHFRRAEKLLKKAGAFTIISA